MWVKKSIRCSLSFVIIISLFGCDPADGKLTLVNNSNDTVYYSVAGCGDSIGSFPLAYKEGRIDILFSSMLLKNEEYHVPVMDTWEYFINNRCSDSTLKIFFFSKDLIKSAGEDSIMKHQVYSKKERLNVKDLEKLNWRVSYP